jgi:hypothetical protein
LNKLAKPCIRWRNPIFYEDKRNRRTGRRGLA